MPLDLHVFLLVCVQALLSWPYFCIYMYTVSAWQRRCLRVHGGAQFCIWALAGLTRPGRKALHMGGCICASLRPTPDALTLSVTQAPVASGCVGSPAASAVDQFTGGPGREALLRGGGGMSHIAGLVCTWLSRCAHWDDYRYASFHVSHPGGHHDWCADWNTDWVVLQSIANLPPSGGRGGEGLLLSTS